MRLFDLIWWNLKSSFRKLRYDLGRELVVLFCSAVILALFFHIFNDFLNTQIAQISENMRLKFAQSLSLILFLVLSIYSGHAFYQLNFKESLDSKFNFLTNQGLAPSQVNFLRISWFTIQYVTLHVLAWLFSHNFLCPWTIQQMFYIQGLSLSLSALYVFILRSNYFLASEKTETQSSEKRSAKSWIAAFPMKDSPLSWRLKLMLTRKRSIQFCLMAALFFVGILWFALFNSFPLPAIFLLDLVVGWMLALALCMQMSDDLESAWFEQIHGMSHEEFLKIHKSLAFRIGLSFSGLVCLPYFFVSVISLNSYPDTALGIFLMTLQLGAICFAPVFLVPQLSMQIDGKKWMISFVSVVLISIFLATACFAHWLGIILFFLIPSFTEPQQIGRFYRA